MCRWLAYSGSPIALEAVLLEPEHSLIDQSLHSRMGAETTNGDGFGVGWYGDDQQPGIYRSMSPAWNDQNLRELAAHVSSRLFFAHIRASSGTPVQQTNCHPFRHDQWLWMHNGLIRNFAAVKRDLMLAVDPSLFSSIAGSSIVVCFSYGLFQTDWFADGTPGQRRSSDTLQCQDKARGAEVDAA